MNRSPISETRWFALSGRELLVLAVAVGAALLVAAATQGIGLLCGRGQVAVHARSETPAPPARLNVNTATDYELTMLPGIGPATAAAIIQYRETHGPFKSLEDLARVKGIGPKTIEAIRPNAMCAPVTGRLESGRAAVAGNE